MFFEFKVAVRYLVSARLQSALLMFGVSVGVVVFTFIAALMNGLSVRLTHDITGNVAHVTLEPELRVPRAFMASPMGRELYAIQPGHNVAAVIRSYRSALDVAVGMPGVRSVVPEVFGNATLARGAHSRLSEQFRARARSLLDRVGLADRMLYRTSKLSGGQKQRVAVARALVMKPELVLADEPTGNLDRKSSDEVLLLLRELSRDEGTAFFISTHDESIALRCDRILTMEDGTLSGPKAPQASGVSTSSKGSRTASSNKGT